jgi:hypothetical protein
MIKNFSKCLQSKLYMTSKINDYNFHSHLHKISKQFNFTLKFNFTNSKNINKKSSESEINKINDYVIKYRPKNISKSGDSLLINLKKLKKLNENNKYTVFQSNGEKFHPLTN